MHLHGGWFHKIYTTHKRTAGLQQLAQSSRIEHGSASMASMVLPLWPAWCCLNGRHGATSMASMVLPLWPAWCCLKGESGGLEESCGLQKVLHVAPQLFLQRCSMGPLLPSGFSVEGAELGTVFLSGWL